MKKLAITMFAMAAVPLFATTRYVVPVGTVGNKPVSPYTSWETAANDLATAIETAWAQDTILVSPGTYSIGTTLNIASSDGHSRNALKIESCNRETGEQDPEHTILDGGGTTSIMIINAESVTVAGFTFANGYAKAESVSSTPSPSAALYFYGNQITDSGRGMVSNCIFRANKSVNVNGTCVSKRQASNAPIVADCRFLNNTQEVTVAKSCVRGSAIYWYIPNSATEEQYGLITGCTFSGNFGKGPYAYGSTLYIPNGRVVLDGCNFYTNQFEQTDSEETTRGAFMSFRGGDITLKNSTISCIGYNNAVGKSLYGTVMRTEDGFTCSNCTFRAINEPSGSNMYGTISIGEANRFLDCRFVDNTLGGAALFYINGHGDELFRNCLFAGNTRLGRCRIFRIYGETYAGTTRFTVENCTFADNSDDIAPIQLSNGNTAYTCNLVNSVFTTDAILSAKAENASLLASNCCFKAAIPGNITDGGGNFAVATVDAMKFVNASNGDYHIQRGSPLREKGLLLSWMTSAATDLDGNLRVVSRYGDTLDADSSALPDIGCYECRFLGFRMIVR